MMTRRYSRDAELVRAGLMALGIVVLVGLALLVASATASAAEVTIANETIQIDETTDTVYVEANNTNSTATANFTATWYGVNETGETEVASSLLSVAPDTIEFAEEPANSTLYDSFRVHVSVDNSTVPEADVSVEVGIFRKLAVGGGLLGGSSLSNTQLIMIAVAAFGGLALLTGRD